jgi:uncharacterized membrane protein
VSCFFDVDGKYIYFEDRRGTPGMYLRVYDLNGNQVKSITNPWANIYSCIKVINGHIYKCGSTLNNIVRTNKDGVIIKTYDMSGIGVVAFDIVTDGKYHYILDRAASTINQVVLD